MSRKVGLAVAARRGEREEAPELRQDQIEDLPRLDFEHPLLKEEAERIGRPVSRNLQNALVHRKHRDARRLAGVNVDGQRRPGFTTRARVERHRLRAGSQVRRKWRDAVRQRAHEQLVGRGIAKELHADVAVAFEVRRQHDPLHRARRRGLEPLILEDALALDGDQSGADVRRANAHFNRVAAAVDRLVELNLQLGVRARAIATGSPRPRRCS